MDQNGETKCRAEPSRATLLSLAVASAVLVSGLNALVQIFKTLAELGGLFR